MSNLSDLFEGDATRTPDLNELDKLAKLATKYRQLEQDIADIEFALSNKNA